MARLAADPDHAAGKPAACSARHRARRCRRVPLARRPFARPGSSAGRAARRPHPDAAGQLFINDHAAALKPDGIGAAEDDSGSSEPANRYIETLPNGVAHAIFKIRDNGRLDNTAEVTVPAGKLFVLATTATIPPTAASRCATAASGCCRSTIWSAVPMRWSAPGHGHPQSTGLDLAVRLSHGAVLSRCSERFA